MWTITIHHSALNLSQSLDTCSLCFLVVFSLHACPNQGIIFKQKQTCGKVIECKYLFIITQHGNDGYATGCLGIFSGSEFLLVCLIIWYQQHHCSHESKWTLPSGLYEIGWNKLCGRWFSATVFSVCMILCSHSAWFAKKHLLKERSAASVNL